VNAPATNAPASPGHRLLKVVLATAVFNCIAAAVLVPFLHNTFFDFLISAQVIGFTLLALVYPVMRADLAPWRKTLLLVPALLLGALLGTVLVVLVKGRDLGVILTDEAKMWSFVVTAMLGLIVGAITVAVLATRARIARADADLMRLEADRQRLARRNAEAELMVVRAQIEPHFLFNTLANLSFLIKDNPDQALAMLENLIDYLQAAVPRVRGESSTLAAEVQMAGAYVAILQIRMGERLRAEIEVPSELLSLPFPPMMLITLVENAIQHGLNQVPEGGVLTLGARRDGDRLELRVADTGAGMPAGGAQRPDGIGLTNIRERLQAMYGDKAYLRLEPNLPRGTVAILGLPIEEKGVDG